MYGHVMSYLPEFSVDNLEFESMISAYVGIKHIRAMKINISVTVRMFSIVSASLTQMV